MEKFKTLHESGKIYNITHDDSMIKYIASNLNEHRINLFGTILYQIDENYNYCTVMGCYSKHITDDSDFIPIILENKIKLPKDFVAENKTKFHVGDTVKIDFNLVAPEYKHHVYKLIKHTGKAIIESIVGGEIRIAKNHFQASKSGGIVINEDSLILIESIKNDNFDDVDSFKMLRETNDKISPVIYKEDINYNYDSSIMDENLGDIINNKKHKK